MSISNYLTKIPHTHIGALTSHPFFKGIDWEKLEKKKCTPPYIPQYETLEVLKDGSMSMNRNINTNANIGSVSGVSGVGYDSDSKSESESISQSLSYKASLGFHDMLKSCNKGAWVANENTSLKHALTTSGKKKLLVGSDQTSNNTTNGISKRFWYFGNMSLSMSKVHSGSMSNSNRHSGKEISGKGDKDSPMAYVVSEKDQEYFKDWIYVSPELSMELEISSKNNNNGNSRGVGSVGNRINSNRVIKPK